MARRRFVVAYDIREPKRLRRVHKAMKGFGEPLQYSVFVCDLDAAEKFTMLRHIGDLIHHHQDSVVVIDLGEAQRRGMECFEFMGVGRSLPRAGPQIV